jgi:four helix bundle protein
MSDFRKLVIWSLSMELVKDIYSFTSNFPEVEKFGLVSQMRRSAVSIPSNIAEGCGRGSEPDFKRFLEIALGSSFELETQIQLSLLLGFSDNEASNIIIAKLTGLQKQLNNLISKIKRDISNKA